MKSISILGFGGHASTVREACVLAGWKIAGFYVEEGLESVSPVADGGEKAKSVSRNQKLNPKDFESNIFVLGIGENPFFPGFVRIKKDEYFPQIQNNNIIK
jgi:hypothetical protein